MIGEITVIPQVEHSERTALSESVRAIAASGLRYQLGVAGASVEGELDAILAVVRAIETRLREHGVDRAVLELRLQLEPRAEPVRHLGAPRRRELLLARECVGYGCDEGERQAYLPA